jgi:mannose-6-phosphate isomerase-like protein (cupin superfamily)
MMRRYPHLGQIVYRALTAPVRSLSIRRQQPAGSARMRTRYAEIRAFTTLDGSEIRELMHPAAQGNRSQSLAEAIVQPGECTLLHRHHASEELYHVTAGRGEMRLGEARFAVVAGDTVLIPPGTAHCIRAEGAEPLRILCCCSPAYSDADTELLEPEPS